MADTAQPQDWNGLLRFLQEKNDTTAISRLYSYAAEEKGQAFEGVRDAIADVFQTYFRTEYNPSNIDTIYLTVPFLVTEANSPDALTPEEKRQSHQKSSSGPVGTLINHEKYESDIVDQLQEQQQNNAVEELDSIRKNASLTEEQKNQALSQKFTEILTKNATAEDAIARQHELLATQLEDPTLTILTKAGELSPTIKIRNRSEELRNARDEEKVRRVREMESLNVSDIQKKISEAKVKREEPMLTREERARLDSFTHLESFHKAEQQKTIQNIDGWVKKFSSYDQDPQTAKQNQDLLVKKLLARQQQRTRTQVYEVFSTKEQGRLNKLLKTGVFKKTLSRPQRRSLLKHQKKQLQHYRSESQDNISIRRNFIARLLNDTLWSEYSQTENTEGHRQQRSPGGLTLPNPIDAYRNIRRATQALRGLSSAGEAAGALPTTGLGAGLSAAMPVILIILAILIFIFIVVILILLLPHDQGLSQQLTRLQCGDQADINSLDNQLAITNAITKRFTITIHPSTQVADEQSLVGVEKQMFSDICVLFGHVQGDTYQDPNKPSVFNTFGSQVIGTVDQRKQDMANGGTDLLKFQWILQVNQPNDSAPCTVSFQRNQNNAVYYIFHSPEQCPLEKLDFLIAQNLGHALVLQQEHIHGLGKSSVFQSFTSTPDAAGIMGQDGLLPTVSCTASADYGEGANNQQQRNCFADMAASYFTYPFYADTPQANSSTSGGFMSFTTKFVDYLTFAKNNLFDGKDLILSPAVSNPGVVKHAAFISQYLQKTFCRSQDLYDQLNPNLVCTPPDLSPINTTDDNGQPFAIAMRGGDACIYNGSEQVCVHQRYWCTDLIIDAYGLAGFTELEKDPTTGNVDEMIKFFQTHAAQGYAYIPAGQFDPNKIIPGSVVFLNFGETDVIAQHVGVISAVVPDPYTGAQGNGTITTFEANAPNKTGSYSYQNGVPASDVVGFGVKIGQNQPTPAQ